MVYLTVGYWIFTVIGIIATIYTATLCGIIIKKYILDLGKLQYQLIIVRVSYDGVNSVITCIYYSSSILSLSNPEILSYDVSFFIALIASIFLEMRSYLAALIAVERAIATISPVNFYLYRKKISNIIFIGITMIPGLACFLVLFYVCGMRFPIENGCSSFACATPLCYQNYLAVSKIFYSSTNALFSGILCVKLFCMSYKRILVPVDLRKANIFSLTDGLSTILFELIPSLIFSNGIIDFKSLGPAMGVLRTIGRTVEASVMVKLMKKTTTILPVFKPEE
ncbi:hypothetical protein B9Z55_018745 [Caenorhabditis nigoni]|uniref:7TM GPCR serpentine receptor class x (Srx) domain-containing protein n=1 Tax=Caenorhabditis nigoni TaxID=1611254 RepID=A0A2G5TFF7_9PELO|nr:hypothetical protein B9Z55_018745 [Caenorhabditis nigoni]